MSAKDIRNIVLLGHSGSGKTTLAESMLYLTGGTDRLGRIADGNTVCDYDPEEIRRQISISLAVAPVEYDSCKINVLDVPGGFDFAGEVAEAVQAADAAVIVCSAKAGMSVGAEKAWKYCEKNSLPRLLYISKTDEENSDYNAAFNTLRERFGKNIAPVVAPIWDESKKVIGIIDVLHKRAFEFGPGGGRVEIEVPENKKPVLDELYDALKESVAETSEEFMEKFFAGEDFTYAEMIHGLRQGVKDLSLFPVVCGSAIQGMGTRILMDTIVELLPQPQDARALMAENEDGESSEFVVAPGALPTAFVFKTISDQFGKYSFIKVLSGKVTSDLSLRDVRMSSTDKLGRMYTMCGKKNTEVKEACCGDIVAIGKMEWKTGDTVCDPKHEVELPAIELAEPCYSMAISPKTKGQDDKVASGLARLNEEDISFTLVNNAETHQMVISGAGDIQVDVLCAKLKSRFGVETELKPARVAYREKIKGKVEAHGRHKKQSGGSGQFGDVWIRFEPQDESDDMIFEEEVFGGSVPKNFFPSVEKGLRNAVQKGVLAGYPLVGLKAVLYDGSYHPVDSNDMAFQTAARLAYQDGIPKAKPTILEPIGLLKVTIPDANLGDIMSDISSKRRGTVLGMTAEDGMQTVEAEVPMAEMGSYTIDLRSMTQGRGSFSCKFVRYEEAPGNVQQKVIEEAKKEQEA